MGGMFNVGGLASGLDSSSMIEQLMAIEAKPRERLEWKQERWELRKSYWNELSTKLNTLRSLATTLNTASTWATFSGITTSDATKVNGSAVGAAPAAGTYDLDITQLAATEVWDSANNLAAATAGQRVTGAWYEGLGDAAEAGDLLTGMTDQTGALIGLNNGSTITMNWMIDGTAHSSTFTVTGASTLSDLMTWSQGQIPASTFTVNGDGTVTVDSDTGVDDEITALSFTARNNVGTQLASFDGSTGAQSSASVFASDGGAAADETLTITQGTNSWFVTIREGDTEADILNRINAVSGIGVTAGLNAGRLRLTSTTSGAGGDFTVSGTGTLVADLGLAESTAGIDASFTMNGTAYTRSSNTGITDLIDDVSVDLLGLTGPTVTLTVGTPAATVDQMKEDITAFVDQYNEIVDYINGKVTEKKVFNPQTEEEYLQGALGNDMAFKSIASDLRLQLNSAITGLPAGFDMLASIGISTGAAGASSSSTALGKLVIDDGELTAALNSDPTKVRDIFQATGGGPMAEKGVARRVDTMVANWITGGRVDIALDGADSQIDSLQRTIDRFNLRLERRRAYFTAMFAAMERSLNGMQTQGQWLSQALSGLNAK